MNLGEILALRRESIIQQWKATVQTVPSNPNNSSNPSNSSNSSLENSHHLTYTTILESLPNLLSILEHWLSQPISEDINHLLEDGLVYDAVNAKQGYDAAEIAREYAVLRNIIFETLETELLGGEPLVMLRTIRLVNGALDKVIALSLDRYTQERIRAVNLLYDELLASNQELDWLVRNEQTNMAHLAHELKSPLSSIIGYSDLFLRQQAQTGEIHPKYIQQVLTSGRLLLSMINEALEMSSYKAGKVKLNFEPVQVCEVVEEVSTVLESLAQQKGLTMGIECSLVNQPIVTDKGRLRQIVTNLISNAVRYTEVGSIHVGVKLVQANGSATDSEHHSSDRIQNSDKNSGSGEIPGGTHSATEISPEFVDALREQTQTSQQIEGDRIEIAVIDTGFGIDETEQDQVFKPYYQGKAGQQLACSTGLGLAITYQMVKMLQGSIHLKSEPGRGSTFTIALPLQYQFEASEME